MGDACRSSCSPSAACCGCARRWICSPICARPWCSRRWPTLEPEARARRRARSDDRARTDRRHLFRRAARHRDDARRQPPRHQHRSLHRGRDRARRARRLRPGVQAPAPAVPRSTRPTSWNRACCGARSRGASRRRLPRCRAVVHVRRQLRDAARAQPEAVRRHRHQQSVRRHPVGLRGDADRLARHAALGLARRAGRDRAAQGALRAGARQRPGHRRQGRRQPARLRSSRSR